MKKNSGQVLIIFLIMIPILITFIAIIGETGYLIYTKDKYSNITKEAINYTLTNNKENKTDVIRSYIKSNLKDVNNITISENDGRIRVIIEKEQKSIFTNLIKQFKYKIKIDYVGYIENNKVIIKE